MITNPTVDKGLGDSGAHVGQIMAGSSLTWPSNWVKTCGVMTLEEAIRGWTSDGSNLRHRGPGRRLPEGGAQTGQIMCYQKRTDLFATDSRTFRH